MIKTLSYAVTGQRIETTDTAIADSEEAINNE